jgi:Xaa-Pro aminopeptidase
MSEAGIDALVILPAGGHWAPGNADFRYLSQVDDTRGQFGAVFPVEGEATFVAADQGAAAHWRATSWFDHVVDNPGRGRDELLLTRLKELKLDAAPIGVVGRAAAALLSESLPAARVIDAGELMRCQRAVKSDEEISMLERAAAVAERGILMLAHRVQVGMPQTEGFAILTAAMLEAGGEHTTESFWDCGPRPGQPWDRAAQLPINRGDVIQNEAAACYAGYRAREIHPISIGKPRAEVQAMFDVAARIFTDGLAALNPGACLASVSDVALAAADARTYATSLTRRNTGLDYDLTDRHENAVLHERETLVLKAIVRGADGTVISIGGTALVTGNGGRRLGRRPLTMFSSHRSFLAPYLEPHRESLPEPWSPEATT